ncbi:MULTISPECIES: L-serine ammonia-lyase [Chromobacterium]|jgi:L-serine dehydratase|uniref:L-serine dehydratase n=3 Tax=Chromobacterium TaxID=535 RepID=A0A2K4MTG3_9NEIS|nr:MULTISPECIES: L-serine ammonia-lyase [Chromobacterium]KIA81332.1 serine dehydratase [Chromobacterium piscinae]MBM2883247.1 L-serine ammonia-lyase [Chromobacterium amazonense]OHX15253.1 L-serine ammonia-lyase [Chromobacterium amazonense]POB00385.1 L-serine ammonia-lyase [Chromobacterium sinusclupearum]PRP71608.1 L-serine ammonia-lyase [Chromobacterium amazonense]
MFSMSDIYKIGVGPSSSHTVGPMKAGHQFLGALKETGRFNQVTRIHVDCYGSLALTGKGHCTDQAIILGLAGNLPDTVDPDNSASLIADVEQTGQLTLGRTHQRVIFGMDFHTANLPLHENGMQIHAFVGDEKVLTKTYYSIGGGFIVDEEHFNQSSCSDTPVPYHFVTAQQLIDMCEETGLSIAALVLENEKAFHDVKDTEAHFRRVWEVMKGSIERGMRTEGNLPGPMRIPRRAPALHRMLTSSLTVAKDPMSVMDWVNMYAMAMSEENAAGGRVVTAPTNGACGIVPAVLAYYNHFIQPLDDDSCLRFFLSSGAIGCLFKLNASISGAEVGCQGEVGVACSMAAAGLTELMGGSPSQVCMAAEIAMEHNLGLTCDPVGGQVQIPCIERNAIAAVKAINAARMAMHRVSSPKVSLDKVIAAMYETGKDMDAKYRETSCGGLALQIKVESKVVPSQAIRWVDDAA